MDADKQSTLPIQSAEPPDTRGQTHANLASRLPIALGISKSRLILALTIAAISDAISFFATPAPPIVWTADIVTAILLFIVLGWRWLLLPGLILEAIPGVSLVPIWLLVVGAIAIWGTARPNLKWLRKNGSEKTP
jgi:hypothetical protein